MFHITKIDRRSFNYYNYRRVWNCPKPVLCSWGFPPLLRSALHSSIYAHSGTWNLIIPKPKCVMLMVSQKVQWQSCKATFDPWAKMFVNGAKKLLKNMGKLEEQDLFKVQSYALRFCFASKLHWTRFGITNTKLIWHVWNDRLSCSCWNYQEGWHA